MSKKLFVGNLPFSVKSEDLKQIFSEHGEVSEAAVITDRFSGRSRGFGFVTFENDADGDKAIEAMNGKDVEGREMTVNEARPQGGSEGGHSGGHNDAPAGDNANADNGANGEAGDVDYSKAA